MSKKEEVFIPALKDKKIPILTLDNNWHRLFTQIDPSEDIVRLEKELNDLLKLQGKVNSETKEIKVLKKKLMAEIVELMDELQNKPSKSIEKKLNENKRLIEECNEKLEQYNSDILDLPKKIEEINFELMLATMESCYELIQENNDEIARISEWVDSMRIELKKNVVIKQQKLKRNQNFYTYMHNIFGADVINIFDFKYGYNQSLDASCSNNGESNK